MQTKQAESAQGWTTTGLHYDDVIRKRQHVRPARRDLIQQALLGNHFPVLSNMVVLAAVLQDAENICAELPPHEYFELIAQLSSAATTIVTIHNGTCGRNNGDSVVAYFLPQLDVGYVASAVRCAIALKSAVAQLSMAWQLRKNWGNSLNLNSALTEGQAWMGVLNGAASEDLVVIGDIVPQTETLAGIGRFGQVWASKSLMGKLPAKERNAMNFGICRTDANGQRKWLRSIYSRVGDLTEPPDDCPSAPRNISNLAVAEIRDTAAS